MMFITENVPSSVKGELTKWMIQLKPGVFLGTLSTLVGEKLWTKIQEKQGHGGAIWVKATNNEQKFKLAISGKNHWLISDFDGLQLITHPQKKLLKKSKNKSINKQQMTETAGNKQITKSNKYPKNRKEIPKINWNTEDTPKNFITRKILFKIQNSKIISFFSGNSNYMEYSLEKLWEKPWTDDIKSIAESLLSYVINLENLSEYPFFNKKLLSLDIETTDYLPKAYEGFVNIIGVAILNLREKNSDKYSLELFQAFNMTRKKMKVPILLELIKPYFEDVDVLLVFNKNFDIKIIKTVINEFSLDINLPSNIIDLQDTFPNLKTLEKFLTDHVNVKRNTTNKDRYSEYYKSFKGQGKKGYNKQIEPIGTYNLSDALTPLFAYLLLNSQPKSHESDRK